MKKSYLVLGLAALVLLGTDLISATNVSNVLQSQDQDVKNTTKIILNWIMGIIGVVALVQSVLIFTGSQQGEDKLKKAGTWIFMVVFMALGLVITNALFK